LGLSTGVAWLFIGEIKMENTNSTEPQSAKTSSLKIVHSSHLFLRFYERDGWTKEELEECIKSGGSVFTSKSDLQEALGSRYFTSDFPGSYWDYEKLMPKIKHIQTYDGKILTGKDAEQYAKRIQNDK
jgi:hypothetical protein